MGELNGEEYGRVRELFKDAEKRLELVEQIGGEVVIPAINQLRYVGFHVLESMVVEGPARAEHIHEAEIHASRAAYDILEAGTLELLLEFDQFKADFRLIPIVDVVPDYLEMCTEVNAARDVLSALENRNHADMHAELQVHFERLLEITRKLEVAREELKKKLRSRDWFVAYSALIAILAVVAIVVSVMVSKPAATASTNEQPTVIKARNP